MDEDTELLRRYAEEGSEDAFRDLVRRRMGLVYSSALRQLGDSHAAQEVAQAVFTDLARKAHALKKRPVLVSWLYTSTHYAVGSLARRERRRIARDLEAYHMQETNSDLARDAQWVRLRPVIDQALHGLDARDREAVLLRYFEGHSFAQVGQALSLSEEAARTRVDRALERLRERLSAKGVASSAAVLAALLAGKMSEAAPAGFADLVSRTAIVQAAGAGVSAGLLAYMAAGKAVLATAALAALLSVGAAVFEGSRGSSAAADLASAQSRYAASVADLKSLEGRVLSAEAALADQRKRLAAGAGAEGAMAAAASPFKDSKARGDQFMERHPEVRAALIAYVDATNRTRYGPLYAALNLSPQQLQSLQVLQRAGFSFGRPIQSGMVTLEAESSLPPSEIGAQIKALLGDEGYRQYDAFNTNLSANDETASLAGILTTTDSPLSPEQVQQMSAIFAGANIAHAPYGFDWAAAYGKAEAVLTPSQLDMLHALGTEAIGWQQVSGYGH